MARTVKNVKIDTRSGRSKLTERREPFWTVISSGCAIGYRKGAKGGTWIARLRDDEGRQHYESLGAADDTRDPDGLTVFSFSQAQETARKFFADKARALAGHMAPAQGPYTVKDALEDYFIAREGRGSKGVRADRYAAEARIVPELGAIDPDKLTSKRIRDWLTTVARAPRLLRTAKAAERRATKDVDLKDPEAVRARRSTANRLLTVLKAALNHAFHEGRIGSDEPWRKVKPFREADSPVVRYLSPSECLRLVNACDQSFRDLVRGALVTGCRYGELTRMRAADFNAEAGMISVRLSKAGKPRHVALADEGRALFASLTLGRAPQDLIFQRADGAAWGASHQQRPLEEASKAAKLDPTATFHILRHTYASSLAMKGVPMGVIAAQLGHSDTRMTEKHYAHLAPSYVADTVRAALPGLGIFEESNVAALHRKAAG
ncbi:tyrosine-type recombinase/integrase [Methylocapsa palsarum]|uniref:Site-specific recombinase XerD n=1 Tax=Methylocapsa palsarum TaxID=1612308 RepID=A0A1I4CE63_9HYPH|nr:site-specific integrase [Methylocapsa palsarum]SFK79225.1 Site-specific recombinase XerD [Methylocapsa palsarum]